MSEKKKREKKTSESRESRIDNPLNTYQSEIVQNEDPNYHKKERKKKHRRELFYEW